MDAQFTPVTPDPSHPPRPGPIAGTGHILGHLELPKPPVVVPEIPLQDYLLSIKIRIKAVDDVDARIETEQLLLDIAPEISLSSTEVKLQQVFTNKPPRNLPLDER